MRDVSDLDRILLYGSLVLLIVIFLWSVEEEIEYTAQELHIEKIESERKVPLDGGGFDPWTSSVIPEEESTVNKNQ